MTRLAVLRPRRDSMRGLPFAALLAGLAAGLTAGPAAALCRLSNDDSALSAIAAAAPGDTLEGIALFDGQPPVAPNMTAARLIDRLSDGCAEATPEAANPACRASAVAAVSGQAISEIRATVGRSVPPFRRMVLRAAALCLARIKPALERALKREDSLSDSMAAATLDAVTAEIEARLVTEGSTQIVEDTKKSLEAIIAIEPGGRVHPFRCAGARFGLGAEGFDCPDGPVAGLNSPAALSEKVNKASGELLDQSVSLGRRLSARAEAEAALAPQCPPFEAGPASYRDMSERDWRLIWRDELCPALEDGGLTEPEPREPPADWSFLADWLESEDRSAVTPEAAIAFLTLPERGEARAAALEAAIEEERTVAFAFRAGVCRLHRLFKDRPELFEAGNGPGAMSPEQYAAALHFMEQVPADQCDGQQ